VIHFDIRELVGVQRARNMEAECRGVNEYAGEISRRKWEAPMRRSLQCSVHSAQSRKTLPLDEDQCELSTVNCELPI
jgi:hypothetical protein